MVTAIKIYITKEKLKSVIGVIPYNRTNLYLHIYITVFESRERHGENPQVPLPPEQGFSYPVGCVKEHSAYNAKSTASESRNL